MNITFDQAVLIILLVIAGGTIWNYLVLHKRFRRLAALYRKDMKDEDVEMIINFEKFIESTNYFTSVEHLKKIETTLQNYHDSCVLLADMFGEIYNMEKNKKVLDYMDKQIDGNYRGALQLFRNTADLWPEFMSKEETNTDGGKKI